MTRMTIERWGGVKTSTSLHCEDERQCIRDNKMEGIALEGVSR